MRANSSASPRPRRGRTAFAALLLAAAAPLPALAQARWYRSDAAGIAYERLPEAAALRGGWALSVETDDGASPRRETKTVYRNGEARSVSVALLSPEGFPISVETRLPDGGIGSERYDGRGRLMEERRTDAEGSGRRVEYRWEGERLLSAAAFALGAESVEPLWTDAYRYDRAGALLSVVRSPSSGAASGGSSFSHDSRGGLPRRVTVRSADGRLSETAYDERGREAETTRYAADGKTALSTERVVYEKAAPSAESGSTRRLTAADGSYVDTVVDGKGRAIREIRYGADGEAVEETRIEWSQGRVASRTTERGGETLRAEFDYDERGELAGERNYRNGVMERSAVKDGAKETETLYREAEPVFRAVYEDGSLVSEERLR